MGLFDLFKKKETAAPPTPVQLTAPVSGSVVAQENVPDSVFASGQMGKCCGIEPSEGQICAPIVGKIATLADTRHALGIRGEGGVDVLIHVGVDTFQMKGEGFESLVREGDAVHTGQPLLNFDAAKIAAAGHPTTVIVAVMNSDDCAEVHCMASGTIKVREPLMKVLK